jgi:hypothetical protein
MLARKLFPGGVELRNDGGLDTLALVRLVDRLLLPSSNSPIVFPPALTP